MFIMLNSAWNMFRTWYCHRIHIYPMIIIDCTLLSLLQHINCLKLHVVKQSKLTLFSWGNSHKTTRISANVQTNMISQWTSLISMKLSSNKGFLTLTGLMGLSMQTRTRQDWTELSCQNNAYNDKFSVKTRLKHGSAIECTYLQWL